MTIMMAEEYRKDINLILGDVILKRGHNYIIVKFSYNFE